MRKSHVICACLLLCSLCAAQNLGRIGHLGVALRASNKAGEGSEVRRITVPAYAEKIGLRVGDSILQMNGRATDHKLDLDSFVNRLRAGERLRIEAKRADKRFTVETVLPERGRETFDGIDLFYDQVKNHLGQRLRVIISKPSAATGKLPVIFVVGWASCASAEFSEGPGDGQDRLLLYLIQRSGFATVRMDKPGSGDSEGLCSEADFQSEFTGYREVLALIPKYAFLDGGRMVALGISNGGGFAPIVTAGYNVKGFVSVVGWGRSWYEHILSHERGRLNYLGRTPTEVDATMKHVSEFYRLLLRERHTPSQILKAYPHLKPAWLESGDLLNDRPPAYYQQLETLNLGEAWSQSKGPVLVVRGEYDWAMSRDDSDAIVKSVDGTQPGRAELVELEKTNHGLLKQSQFRRDETNALVYDPAVEGLVQSFLNRLFPAAQQ